MHAKSPDLDGSRASGSRFGDRCNGNVERYAFYRRSTTIKYAHIDVAEFAFFARLGCLLNSGQHLHKHGFNKLLKVHFVLLCRGPRRSVDAGRRGLVLYLAIVTEAKAVLVLSRNKDERIVIGGDIVITVVEIRGDKVRLGIEAPKEVSILRQELLDDDRTEAA